MNERSNTKQIQFLVEGEWVTVVDGPPAWRSRTKSQEDFFTELGWYDFGFLDVYHREHGHLRICPRHYPSRVA